MVAWEGGVSEVLDIDECPRWRLKLRKPPDDFGGDAIGVVMFVMLSHLLEGGRVIGVFASTHTLLLRVLLPPFDDADELLVLVLNLRNLFKLEGGGLEA